MKFRVDVDELRKLKDELYKVNKYALEDLIIVKDGVEIEVDKVSMEDWRFIGLDNVSFILDGGYNSLLKWDKNGCSMDTGDFILQPYLEEGKPVIRNSIIIKNNPKSIRVVTYRDGGLSPHYTCFRPEECVLIERKEVPIKALVALEDYYRKNIYDPFDHTVGE